jgi:hypothetical protein
VPVRALLAGLSLTASLAVPATWPALGSPAMTLVSSSPDPFGTLAPEPVPLAPAAAAPRAHARPASRSVIKVVQPVTPQPHGPCPAYGTVLVSGSQWLAGRGVDVMSNGGSGANCFSLEPGHVWQCTELVNRFLVARGWSPAIAGDAGQFFDNASAAAFDKHPVGDGYLPIAGDVIVWGGGVTSLSAPFGYGHVAVVTSQQSGVVGFVQQNSTISGHGALPVDAVGNLGASGGLRAIGYLHAKANSLAPAPKPKPSHPVKAAKPQHHHAATHPVAHPPAATPVPAPAPPAVAPPTTAPAPTPAPAPSPPPSPTPTVDPTPSVTPTVTPTADPIPMVPPVG